MYWQNFMIWKKKSKILIINKSLSYIWNNLSYWLKCRKNTESKNPKVAGTKNGRIMLLSKCAVCESKNRYLLKIKKVVDY